MSEDPYTFLIKAVLPEVVEAVTDALEDADIPYRSGLLAVKRPSVIFTVPTERLEEAQTVVAEALSGPARAEPARFPVQPVVAVGSLIGLHFSLLFGMLASADAGRRLIRWGGLLAGGTSDEPWRLITYLFLHSDPLHVFWNGASMMVFGVPLLGDLRYARTCLIYLGSGIGGGITALQFARAGTLIVGSSGAVAGLFGAWVVLTLGRSHLEPLTRRARIRAMGIAMLVLPTLLSPVTSTGESVSVSAHMGGLATGAVVGALISFGLLRHRARREVDSAG